MATEEHFPCTTTSFMGVASHYKWVRDEADNSLLLYCLHWSVGKAIETLEDLRETYVDFADTHIGTHVTDFQAEVAEGLNTGCFAVLTPPALFNALSALLMKNGYLAPGDADGLVMEKQALLSGALMPVLKAQ